MPIFIKLKSDDRAKLFYALKNKLHKSWESIYPDFGVSRSMFFNYLSGRYYIPEKIFSQLQNISGLKIVHTQEIYIEKYVKKDVIKPKMNSELAEIFGIINGDGHIDKEGREICIVGNALEADYFNYLKDIFERNFNLKFTMFKMRPTALKLRVYSKGLVEILVKNYGFPFGHKTGKLSIPKHVFKSKEFLISYIRGLFDTDGSIYVRRKKDMVVEIISVDKNYLNQIKEALFSLNFKAGISGKNLYIYNQEDIKRFFEIIKPANSKHLKRFSLYSKNQALVV